MISRRLQFALILGASLGIAASCTPSEEAQSATIDTTRSTGSGALAPLTVAGTRYVVAPSGNEVRYRVREQLVGFDLPNDAIGKSTAVTGVVAIDDAGKIIRDASRFVIDAGTFASDRDRRDNYVRGRLLEAAQYPSVVFVPTEARGITLPPSGSGTSTFDLIGDLTVRGVTRPTTWRVTATVTNDQVSGSATTKFAFADFQMAKPQVRSVLSVADTIALEYDFRLVREQNTK
jgi:polyisoprenoid-binding protein YceI